MTVVVNPAHFSVTDNVVAIEGDTAFILKAGTVSGGPYTASSATVQISTLTAANGVYTGQFSSLTWSPPLAPFTTYFAVAEVENAQGVSGNTPEASFSVATTPAPPLSLAFA